MQGSYSYPFLAMNHHALMLFMLRKNLKLLGQITKEVGMPVRPIPPMFDHNPDRPCVLLCAGPQQFSNIELDKIIRGNAIC